MQKRLVSIFLSLLMIFTCIAPVTALAADVYYDVMFVDENGDMIDPSVYSVKKGTCIDSSLIPALPQGSADHEEYIADDGGKTHSSYSWDSDPATTPIVTNTVFTRVRTTEKHDYNFGKPQFAFTAESKTGLMAFYECSKCGSIGEVGLEFGEINSDGLKVKVDASAIGGDGIVYEGNLDAGTLKTALDLASKVGVPVPGWLNTAVTVLDKVADIAGKIAEATCTCSKEGHLYGETPTYAWSSDRSTCIATFTCTRSDCKSNYDGHFKDVSMKVTGPEYSNATCTTDGKEVYTATVKFKRGNELEWEDYQTTYETVWQKAYGHSFTVENNNDATCTEDGTYSQICTRCGVTITKPLSGSALGHSPGRTVIENEVPATCTSTGSYDAVKYCVRCGVEMSRENVISAKLEHTPKLPAKEDYVEATCTADGSYNNVVRCADCNSIISTEPVVIPKKEHTRRLVIENATEATCTTGGTYERIDKCIVCNTEFSRETVTIPASDHDFEDVVTPATCNSEGTTYKVCKVCGFSFLDSTEDALEEHSYVETARIEPTCSAKGEIEKTCSVCGDVVYEDIAMLSHNWDDGVVTEKATCTNNGIKTFTCSLCGKTRTEEIVSTGHDYKAVITHPSCEEGGYTTYTCANCGDSYKEDYTPANGHTEGQHERENEIAASCTDEGSYDEVVYCADCGAKLWSNHYIIPKNGHNTDKIVVLPTCTAQGHTDYTCKVCGYTYSASFTDCIDHTKGEPVRENVVPATCTKDGSFDFVIYCTECNTELQRISDNVEKSEGHKWDSGKITTQPTTTETGIKTYTCSVCGETRTEILPIITVEEATPDDKQADDANVNKNIEKPKNIRTVSQFKKNWLHIMFEPVEGAQNYRVMYRKAGEKEWKYSWTDGKTDYYLRNLKKGGLYEFMFAAYKKNADDEWERGAYSVTSYRYYYKEKIKKVKAGKKSIKVTWVKDKNGDGYELFYATNAKMKNRKKIVINNKNKTSYTIKKLKSGKKYYIRVRSIKKSNGKRHTGEFSSQKKLKAKQKGETYEKNY